MLFMDERVHVSRGRIEIVEYLSRSFTFQSHLPGYWICVFLNEQKHVRVGRFRKSMHIQKTYHYYVLYKLIHNVTVTGRIHLAPFSVIDARKAPKLIQFSCPVLLSICNLGSCELSSNSRRKL